MTDIIENQEEQEQQSITTPPVYEPKKVTKPPITAEYLQSTTKISGWLTFFLVIVVINGLINGLAPIVAINLKEFEGFYAFAFIDIFLGLMLLFIAIYTVIAFNKRKPDAVFAAKTFVATAFLTNLLVLVVAKLMGSTDEINTMRIVRSLIWGTIWFMYLCFSVQVSEVIPEEYRKTSKTIWISIASLIIVPIVLMVIGFLSLLSHPESLFSQEEKDDFLKEYVLAQQEKECTDGKVVFSVPFGFTCEQAITDKGVPVYELKSLLGDELITINSNFLSNPTKSDFDEFANYMLDINALEVISDDYITDNTYPFYLK